MIDNTVSPRTGITVGFLRQQLDGEPDDMLVVLSKDGEGNGFSPLSNVVKSFYEPTSTWAGDTYLPDDVVDAAIASGEPRTYTEEDRAPRGLDTVVVLWPTN